MIPQVTEKALLIPRVNYWPDHGWHAEVVIADDANGDIIIEEFCRHTRGSGTGGVAGSLRRRAPLSLTASNCRSRPMMSRAALSQCIADIRAIDGHFSSWQDYQRVTVRDFESKTQGMRAF